MYIVFLLITSILRILDYYIIEYAFSSLQVKRERLYYFIILVIKIDLFNSFYRVKVSYKRFFRGILDIEGIENIESIVVIFLSNIDKM